MIIIISSFFQKQMDGEDKQLRPSCFFGRFLFTRARSVSASQQQHVMNVCTMDTSAEARTVGGRVRKTIKLTVKQSTFPPSLIYTIGKKTTSQYPECFGALSHLLRKSLRTAYSSESPETVAACLRVKINT